MKIQKVNHQFNCEKKCKVKNSQKQDLNLKSNSTLYFQIGLIVALLVTYGLFEMKFETNIKQEAGLLSIDDNNYYIDVIEIKEKIPEVVEIQKQRNILTVNPLVFPDDISTNDFKEEFSHNEPQLNNTFNPNDIVLVKKPEESPMPFERVEQVPIYPGCENAKSNDERKACMSNKINKLIQKKFNGNLASEYGLTGIQRISVVFKIDKTGHITDIKTRAPHPGLENEANRIIKLIPEMQPGKQRDKPVGVIYSLPIVFQVQY